MPKFSYTHHLESPHHILWLPRYAYTPSRYLTLEYSHTNALMRSHLHIPPQSLTHTQTQIQSHSQTHTIQTSHHSLWHFQINPYSHTSQIYTSSHIFPPCHTQTVTYTILYPNWSIYTHPYSPFPPQIHPNISYVHLLRNTNVLSYIHSPHPFSLFLCKQHYTHN
jgi:hypothetical protein